MTHEQLIQIVEQRQAELETELSLNKQVLALLHGVPPRHPKPLRSGPIVYGNGHHDGKKPKKPKGILTQGVKDLTVNEVVGILKANPLGLTLVEIQGLLAKKNIHISTSSIYNAFRRQNVAGARRLGQQAMFYKIQPKENQPK